MSNVIDTINRYKAKSADLLQSQQEAYIPRLEDQIEYVTQAYTINNQRVVINQMYHVCFKLKYLKWGTASKTTIDTYLDYKKKKSVGIDDMSIYNEYVKMNGLEYNMKDLVNNKIIRPFLLFIDGVFIPWEIMYIHLSREQSYLTVKTNMHKNNSGKYFYDERFGSLIRSPRYAQIVSIPDYIGYTSGYSALAEDKKPTPDEIIFAFDHSGKYNTDNPEYVYYFKGTRTIFNTVTKTWAAETPRMYLARYSADGVGVSAVPVFDNVTDIEMDSSNVFLFTNGILTTGETSVLKIAKEIEIDQNINIIGIYKSIEELESVEANAGDYAQICIHEIPEGQTECPFEDSYYRYNGYSWKHVDYIRKTISGQDVDEIDIATPIEPNPEIRFDSTLLTIGDGTNRNSYNYRICVFANRRYDASVDNIVPFEVDPLSEVVDSINNGGEAPAWFADASEPFQFKMDRTKTYEENVANAIKYMMHYNPAFFGTTIYNKSRLDVEEKNTEWIYAYMSDQGVLTIPRRHYEGDDECILLFVNGEIYPYMSASSYIANQFIVPINGINNGDRIELWRFKGINNNTYDIVIDEADGFVNYSPDIINDDMVLFSPVPDVDYFDFSGESLQQFPVDYSLETDADGKIKIILANNFYYDKPLTVAYKSRYVHYTYRVTQEKPEFAINLGNSFKFCHDMKRYSVFYNGRRIDPSKYRLVVPNSPTLPFVQFKLYMSIPVTIGDRVDVIYSPIQFEDVVIYPTIPTSGDLVVEKDLMDYILNPNLYMVWVNGKKVPASSIAVIDSTHMRIMTDENSVEYVAITKQIPSVEEIADAFHENESLWDSITKQLSDEEIEQFFGIPTGSLSANETSIVANAVGNKQVMYELVREEYLNSFRVDTTEPFLYDYEDKTLVEEDGIINVADASIDDNIAEIDRDPYDENV